jgi:hypothetical protein
MTDRSNDPTITTHTFSKGDRVKLSLEGIHIFAPARRPAGRRGIVACNPLKDAVAVKWDGLKSVQYLSRNFLERYDD